MMPLTGNAGRGIAPMGETAGGHEFAAHLPCEIDLDLIRRLDRNGPRYTSYPTADRFVEAFDARTYAAWAARRDIGALQRGLSLYVHLPFCATVCFYCACNKVVTRNRARGTQYMEYLAREISLQAALFGDGPEVSQMHWGGGTPTFFEVAELKRLNDLLRRHFTFAPRGEYSIEIDPRTVNADTVAALRAMGFNRMSLGVQDFDPDVQRAVNRVQSEGETQAVTDAARACGFESVNFDLIYGLPRQTLLSFNRTLARVAAMQPDRIAVYNYAHLPARFKPQRRISAADLPAPETRLKLLALAVERLTEAGYVYIGMDHFAKPGDALAVAQRQGRLHRNFQGYSTQPDCDLVGLGVSAIGAIGPTYSQNSRDLPAYYDALDRGVLPVARGIELTADDVLRRAVIQSLMCHFALNRDAIGVAHLIDFDRYFARELDELATLARHGLLELDGRWINVTPKGRFLIRSISMVFDRYLRQERETERYSRVI
jgi:oxygen-independent coproporphyrinogen-3 oxidase